MSENEDKPVGTRSQRLRTASQERRDQDKQDVRQAILQASSELFLKHGYEHFSLRQVAEQIGYSPGTLYLYFKDKDDILLTLMRDGLAEFARRLNAALAVSDVRGRLEAMGRAYVLFGLENRAYYQLMFMQRTDYLFLPDNPPPPELISVFGQWRTTVEEAMKAGILRMGDPGSTGDALWALLHGVVSIALLMPNFDARRVRELTDTALEMIVSGVHPT